MPANATVDSKLPVWLYIQGGGYADNSNANYNGTEVIEQSGGNIVFVNFNYRVGIFGFLASQDVVDDGDLNVGLLDQRMVMKWVHEHIAQVRLSLFTLRLSLEEQLLKLFCLYSLEAIPIT